MATNKARSKALAVIARNIKRSGFHLYLVEQDACPRFAYTIGLRETQGAELVLAGGIYYDGDEVAEIIHEVRDQLGAGAPVDRTFIVKGLGSFVLRDVDASWVRSLMLGATDYYDVNDLPARQIVPTQPRWTVDVPDMTRPWSAITAPAWRWLHELWDLAVPPTSTAITNLDALRGGRITEVTRWEDDHWEMFAGAGPDVSREDTRLMPLGTLLASDPSLAAALDLALGRGIWRDHEHGDWVAWGRGTS